MLQAVNRGAVNEIRIILESYDTETGPSAMNLFSTPKSRFVFIKQRLLPIVQTSARLECPPPHLGLKSKLQSRHLRFSAPLWWHSIWNIHQSHITQMDISEAKHNIYINSSAELKDQPHSLWGGTVCSTLQSWHWIKSKAYFKLCSGGIWALASCHWLLLLKRSPFKKKKMHCSKVTPFSEAGQMLQNDFHLEPLGTQRNPSTAEEHHSCLVQIALI